MIRSYGPGCEIPADDLALLEPMLRSSNDDAASTLWVRDGWEEIVNRVMHTTGTADRDDRRIVAVRTSEPTMLSWADSADRITEPTGTVCARSLA